MYQYICVSVCVCLCVRELCYRVLDPVSSPKLRPFKDHISDNLHSSFILVFGKGIQVVYALHVNLWFSSKMFRQEKQHKQKKNIKSIQNSYWQTTQWNIWRILKSLFSHCISTTIYKWDSLLLLETITPMVTQHSNTCSSLSSHTLLKQCHAEKSISVLYLWFSSHDSLHLCPPLSVNWEADVCMLVV